MDQFHNSERIFRTNTKVDGLGKTGKNILPVKSFDNLRKQTFTEKGGQVMTIETKSTPRNAIFPAKNIFTLAPDAILEFINGGNTVYLSMDIVSWLESSTGRPDIGLDAIDAINNIKMLQDQNNKSLVFFDSKPSKALRPHMKDDIDLRIIDAAIKMAGDSKNSSDFDKIKFVTRNSCEQIMAKHRANGSKKLVVNDYFKDTVSGTLKDSILETTILFNQLTDKLKTFPLELVENHADIAHNEGIIVKSNYTPGVNKIGSEIAPSFAAIRKFDHFEIISPNISAAEIKPYSKDDVTNWSQAIALRQLLDEKIPLSIVAGTVGSGKTLLAIASGIYQVINKKYKKLIITRPMVPFADEEKMGFLPGDKVAKMFEYIQPINDALDFISEISADMKSRIETLREKGKIIIESINYIRGRTFRDAYIVVDEDQNATPHQNECAMERVGEGSKIVLVGDPNQVDKRDLGKRSNGLVVSMDRMRNDPLVSICYLQSNERSALSRLVHQRFNQR